jgi:hypothetical protein
MGATLGVEVPEMVGNFIPTATATFIRTQRWRGESYKHGASELVLQNAVKSHFLEKRPSVV